MFVSKNDVILILQKEDIEGLVALGAPKDEYNQEAEEISDALNRLSKREKNENFLIKIISQIWAKSFGLSSADIENRIPAFKKLANHLLIP